MRKQCQAGRVRLRPQFAYLVAAPRRDTAVPPEAIGNSARPFRAAADAESGIGLENQFKRRYRLGLRPGL
jgi:hypothetical protein